MKRIWGLLLMLAATSFGRAQAEVRTKVEAFTLSPARGPQALDQPEPPGPPARQLTLEECVQIAVQHATSVLKSDANTRFAGAQVAQSYAQFLPNLTTSAVLGEAWGNNYQTVPKPSVYKTANYGLAFQLGTSVNLFNGFADAQGLKAALAKKDAADLSLQRAKQQIAIDITQNYLQVILDQRLLDIAKQSFATSKKREELLREQTKLGVKDIGNLYTQQAQTATDETAVVSAVSRLQTDIMRLLQRLKLTGEDFQFAPPQLTEAAPFAGVADAELVRKALSQRADVGASQRSAAASEHAVQVAEGGYYPHLDLGLTMYDVQRTLQNQAVNGVDQGPFVQDPFVRQLRNHLNYAATLTLSWTIFDREVTRLSVARAEYEAATSSLDNDDLRMQVLTEVKQAREDFRGASSRLASAQRGVVAAAKSFERIDARYGIGAATFLDLTTAQVVLAQAKASEAQARIDVHFQAQVLAHVVGETRL